MMERTAGISWFRRAGLTLLELLATIVIFSLLMLAVGHVLTTSILARQRISQQLEVVDRATGTMDLLVQDLKQIHVYDSRAYLFVESPTVSGKGVTSVAFACLTPVRVSDDLRERPGLIEVAYLVGEDPAHEGAMRVFRREMPIETDPRATSIRTSDHGLVLLADNLEDFHMEFLAPPAAGTTTGTTAGSGAGTTGPSATAVAAAAAAGTSAQPEFSETWAGGFGRAALPAAVRITVRARGEGAGAPMQLERTVRLPVDNVENELLQSQLRSSVPVAR